MNIIQIRKQRTLAFRARGNAEEAAIAAVTLDNVVPYKDTYLPKETLSEFNIEKKDIEPLEHKVDYVKTNAIMQGYAAKTLHNRYKVKTMNEEKVR